MLLRLSDWLFGCYFSGDEGGAGGSGGSGGSGEGGGEGAGAGEGGGGGEGGTKTYEEAYVKQLRNEAAANRKKAADLEARLKAVDDEKLSETDKLKKAADEAARKATEAEQKARARIARAEVLTAATKLNLIDPDVAHQLVKERIEFNEEGEPKNVDELLQQLAKEKPYLVKQEGGGAGSGGAANPAAGRGRSLSADAVRELARTNPMEFNRRYEAGEFRDVLTKA